MILTCLTCLDVEEEEAIVVSMVDASKAPIVGARTEATKAGYDVLE